MKKLNVRLQTRGIRVFLEKVGYPNDIRNDELQGILDATLSNPALTQREIEILTERNGFRNNTGGTYKEVGSRLGCTGNNVRLLEQNALRKIHHPERSSDQTKTRIRLRKLIPTLEYDVLYDPSSLARVIDVSGKYLKQSVNELSEEFDLAQVIPYIRSDRHFVMRIGEQSQNLEVPSDPIEIPEELHQMGRHHTSYFPLDEFIKSWNELRSRILTKGVISSSFANEKFYQEPVRILAFREFMIESTLPVAVHQDYRFWQREPIVVYHPKILRGLRSSEK